MDIQRLCRKCGTHKPATKEYFGHQPNGNFRRTCRECMSKHVAAHSRQNPELAQERARKRREQSKQAQGSFTKADILHIRNQLSDSCYYCGQALKEDYEIDHKVPISRGGSHFPVNLTLACYECNKEKHNKTVDEYKQWRLERKLHIIDRDF